MKHGDPVEVRQVWAAGGPMRPPLRHWFKGYLFERQEKRGTVLVRVVGGTFDGIVVRYPREDVRAAVERERTGA